MTPDNPDPFSLPDLPPSEAADGVILERCRELVQIKKEADRLDARLEVLKKRRGELETFLLDAFADNPDMQSVRIAGRTVYLHRQLWAGAPDKAAAYDALIRAGLSEYADKGFNTNKVSALYREWDKNGEAPPPELEGVITTGERFSIRVTR